MLDPRVPELPVDWPALSAALRRVALALTRREHDADDLMQHALASVLARAPDRIGYLPYVRQVLVRHWLDQQRSARRRMAHWWRLARSWPAASNAGEVFDQGEAAQRAAGAIEGLPPQQRAVFALRVVEELDYPQIAQTLGCSLETVRANLHQARRKLRLALGDLA